jgi:hypothetical protein
MTARMADQYRPEPGAPSFTCADCGIAQDHLARFPGDRCIDCHDVATRDVVITAADLVRAFGGRS